MSEDELRRYRLTRDERHRDFSVVLPPGADPNVIARVLATVQGVTTVTIIDHYAPRMSYTYRVSTYGDGDIEQLQREVTELLVGIGCTLR
jgi:prephenate dehydrogenase